MRLVLRTIVIGALAATAVACSRDTGGTPVTLDPLAAVRFVNAVADTSALDFRIIDIVGDAPNFVSATFRTGGLAYGAPNNVLTQPPYQAVRAGSRHIRVFMNGTTPAIASQIVFDTTFNFVEGRKYSFILHGNARTGSTPGLNAVVLYDSVPTIPAGRFAVRVVNMAPTLASSVNQPAVVTSPVDITIGPGGGAVPAGAATVAALGFGGVSSYVTMDTSSIVAGSLPIRVLVAAAGTAPLVVSGTLPVGVRGSATDNPTPGTRVVGSAMTIVITPRSVPGSSAPVAPATRAVTSITRSNDTATVTSTAAHGLVVGDVVNVSGTTEAEYNGPVTIIAIPTTTTFLYRMGGTPVTPGTGTSVFRISQQGTTLRGLDYSTPAVTFLLDQRPPNTAP